jgi:hypothetical protein
LSQFDRVAFAGAAPSRQYIKVVKPAACALAGAVVGQLPLGGTTLIDKLPLTTPPYDRHGVSAHAAIRAVMKNTLLVILKTSSIAIGRLAWQ